MAYPYEDDRSGFSAEQLADWEQVIDDLNDLFGAFAREDEDFVVALECPDRVTIDLDILNARALAASVVMNLALSARESLRLRSNYWRVRIWLCPPREADRCLWLEIDRFLITPYRGQKTREEHDSIDALIHWFWGTA